MTGYPFHGMLEPQGLVQPWQVMHIFLLCKVESRKLMVMQKILICKHANQVCPKEFQFGSSIVEEGSLAYICKSISIFLIYVSILWILLEPIIIFYQFPPLINDLKIIFDIVTTELTQNGPILFNDTLNCFSDTTDQNCKSCSQCRHRGENFDL